MGARLPGHLGILRAREAAHFVLAEQHAFDRRVQIRLLHQGGADQEAVGEVAQLAHFSIGMDADSLITVTSGPRRAAS